MCLFVCLLDCLFVVGVVVLLIVCPRFLLLLLLFAICIYKMKKARNEQINSVLYSGTVVEGLVSASLCSPDMVCYTMLMQSVLLLYLCCIIVSSADVTSSSLDVNTGVLNLWLCYGDVRA